MSGHLSVRFSLSLSLSPPPLHPLFTLVILKCRIFTRKMFCLVVHRHKVIKGKLGVLSAGLQLHQMWDVGAIIKVREREKRSHFLALQKYLYLRQFRMFSSDFFFFFLHVP